MPNDDLGFIEDDDLGFVSEQSPEQPIKKQKVSLDPKSILSDMKGKSPAEWNQLRNNLERFDLGDYPELQMNLDIHAGTKEGDTTLVPPLADVGKHAVEAFNVTGGGPGNKVIGEGLKKIAQKLGLDQIPDRVMQAAMGAKKYIPGMGTRAMDQGIVGTRGMMAKQAASKIPAQSKITEQLVKKPGIESLISKTAKGDPFELGRFKSVSYPKQVSSELPASRVFNKSERFLTPGGKTTGAGQESIDLITKRASEIEARGAVPASEALGYKQLAGGEGFKAGKPLAKLESELARAEGAGYKEGILEAMPNPAQQAKVAESLANTEALYKAKQAANSPLGISDISSLIRGGIKMGALPLSAGAHVIQKGGKAIASSADPLYRLIHQKRSSMKDDSGDSDDNLGFIPE